MSGKKIHLRIITPTALKFDEKADMIIMRSITGDVGIMSGHEPYATMLDYGILRILDDGGERKIAVIGGYAQVLHNEITILTKTAEWPEEIDRTRAEADLQHAEELWQGTEDDLELQRAQILLRRSLVLIEASSYVYISKHQ